MIKKIDNLPEFSALPCHFDSFGIEKSHTNYPGWPIYAHVRETLETQYSFYQML